jgi:class 3 adenylate cyclase
MKKKSLLLIFALGTILVSYIQYRLDLRSANLKSFEIILVKKERDVRLLSAITESLLVTSSQDLIDAHLTDSIRVGWIDFYMLTYRGEVLSFNSVRPLSDEAYGTLASLHPPDTAWEFRSKFESAPSIRGPAAAKTDQIEDFRFIETDLGGERRLKLGFNLNREAFLAEMKLLRANENQRILIWGMILSILIFLFTARDLFKIVRAVRTKGVRGLESLSSMSAEAEILKQGFSGYQETVERLQNANRVLGAQILPSLKSELQSGKVPPYDFACTLVRTDINDFTKTFHSKPQDEFLATINEFFTECSHVISRYNGLIHEFVGDEIIFYFKDEKHVNSFSAALSCVYEIGVIANRIHQRTSVVNHYGFRIKTSLSHGVIRFGPLLNGYSLAGAPLIETSRVLSHVSEKNENTVHFDSRCLPLLDWGVEFEEAFRANLKGLDGERQICRYKGHRNVQMLLDDGGQDAFRAVHAYRDESSFLKVLKFIVQDPEHRLVPDALQLISGSLFTKCSDVYLSELERLLNQAWELKGGFETQTVKLLATVVSALPRLIPAGRFNGQFGAILEKFSEHSDPRVAANAIQSMQEFRDTGFASLNKKLLKSENVRIAANAIVFLGKIEVTKQVVKEIGNLLDSGDLVKVGSGIYVWGEVAGFHLQRDAVHLRTQTDFMGLEKRVKAVVAKHPSLRRLAEEAARKASGAETNKAVA